MADFLETDADLTAYAAAPYTAAEEDAVGLRPVTKGGSLYCPLILPFAINGVTYAWPKGMVLGWNIGMARLGDLTDVDMKEGAAANFAQIESYIRDLKFVYNPNPKTANFLTLSRKLDAQGGILAQHRIVMPGATAATQLPGEFDVSERWVRSRTAIQGAIDFDRTHLHEVLHGLGLGHGDVDKADPALIEPMYSWSIWALQPRDIAELQRRYSKAEVAPSPPAAPSARGQKITLESAGYRYTIDLNPTAANVSAIIKAVELASGKETTLSGAKPWGSK